MPAEQLDTNEAVQAYKDLSRVERAFRSLKTINLDIHLEWRLRDALAPLLFHELVVMRAERHSPLLSTDPSGIAQLQAEPTQAPGARIQAAHHLTDA